MAELDVTCPRCNAAPGKQCVILADDPPETDPRRTVHRAAPHPERLAAGSTPATI